MPDITVDVYVYCSCGEHLCNQSTVGTTGRGTPSITVEPCQRCLDAAYDKGFDAAEESAKEAPDA